MKGICRDNDTAGGDLIPTQDFVFVDGNLVIVDNDPVQGHGVGEHAGPTMIASTANVFINNISKFANDKSLKRNYITKEKDCTTHNGKR